MPPPTSTRKRASIDDGRTARTERTKDAVVEALLSLIQEGDLRPSAQRIAERTGVSLRTIFHHYQDMESLFAATAEAQFQRLLAMMRVIPRSGPLDGRMSAFVAERARLLEAISPVRRSALLSEPFSDELHARLTWARARARIEIERVFALELNRGGSDGKELLHALTAAASWSSWEALRSHQGLTAQQARRVMTRTISALLKEDQR